MTIRNGDDRNAPIGSHNRVQELMPRNMARAVQLKPPADGGRRDEMAFEKGSASKRQQRNQCHAKARQLDNADHG
jgi:hypothetical protein